MYTGTLTLCAVIAIFSIAAIVTDRILDRLVFSEIEEDATDAWFEAE